MSAYSDAVLADAPLMYARLGLGGSNVLNDSSGNARHGNVTYGNPTTAQPSLIVTDTADLSCWFGGACEWYDAAWMDNASITMEAWARPESLAAICSVLDRDTSGGRIWQFRINGSKKFELIFWTSGGGPYFCAGTTTLAINTIYHLVATYDAATGVARVYVNGVQDGTATVAANPMYSSAIPSRIAIGGSYGGIGSNPQYAPFTGRIDEAAIYGSALSAARILAHYTAGTVAASSNDLWVWNGTALIPANVTVWNGTTETAANVEVTGSPSAQYGVPSGTTLTTLAAGNNPYGGNTFTSSKYVINGSGTFTGWKFQHRVEVQAGTVNFVNCLFEGAPADTTTGSVALLLNATSGTGTVTATNCTFNPASPYSGIDGIRGDRMTLDRCEITRTVDGGQLYGVGSITVKNSWIHDLIWYDDGSHPDGSHNDGFQIVQGSNITIENNLFDGAMFNTGVYIQQSLGAVSNLSIKSNFFDCEYPGAMINLYDAQGAGPITGFTMTGNSFRHASPAPYQMLISGRTKNHASTVISGNVWDDGSLPVPPVNTGS